LALDPLGGFNLTLEGVGKCIYKILESKLPTMFLGGGGYNPPNAARYLILRRKKTDIPPHWYFTKHCDDL